MFWRKQRLKVTVDQAAEELWKVARATPAESRREWKNFCERSALAILLPSWSGGPPTGIGEQANLFLREVVFLRILAIRHVVLMGPDGPLNGALLSGLERRSGKSFGEDRERKEEWGKDLRDRIEAYESAIFSGPHPYGPEWNTGVVFAGAMMGEGQVPEPGAVSVSREIYMRAFERARKLVGSWEVLQGPE